MEGIATDGGNGFWIANEGHAENARPQALFHVNAEGTVTETVDLPADLVAGATTNGLVELPSACSDNPDPLFIIRCISVELDDTLSIAESIDV